MKYLLLLCLLTKVGSFSISPLFANSMVLQRGNSTAIFGTSSPSDVINVSLNGGSSNFSGITDSNGHWIIHVSTGNVGSISNKVTVSSTSGSSVTLTDVAFGDVFVVLGEGNAVSQVYNQ